MSRSTARGRIFGPSLGIVSGDLLGRFLHPEIDPNVIVLALEIIGASSTETLSTTGELSIALSFLGALSTANSLTTGQFSSAALFNGDSITQDAIPSGALSQAIALLGASVTDGTQTSGTAGIVSTVSAATNQPTIATDGAIASIQGFDGSSQTPALLTVGEVVSIVDNPYSNSVLAAFSGVEWFIGQEYPNDIPETLEFSFRALADASPASSGRIFESGGGAWGTTLYAHNGRIYFQTGNGGAQPQIPGSSITEVSWAIPTGTNQYLIEGSALLQNGYAKAALYIDGVPVQAAGATALSFLSGADPGTVSPPSGTTAPATRGLAAPYSDTIAGNKIDIYPNQSTNLIVSGLGGFATNGMDELAWIQGGEYLDLVNSKQFSAKAYLSIAANNQGDIFKFGGAGIGMCLYAHSGRLYFQGGDGSETGRAYGTNVVEAFWDITPGTYCVEVSVLSNTNGTKAAIYIDGSLISVGQATFDGPIGGGLEGIVLPINSSPFHRGTRNLAFNGTLVDNTVLIYPDQSTPEVQ